MPNGVANEQWKQVTTQFSYKILANMRSTAIIAEIKKINFVAQQQGV